MVDERSYSSPTAFRRALTDKLKVAAETSKWTLPQLQRQMAYDRLLERLYLVDEGWIVKGAATFDRYGDTEAPSTRYKDLVDLVAIATEASVEAEAQMAALASEAARRRIRLPQRFGVPAPELWERGYAAEAGRSLLPMARTLDEALAVVSPFLDPLLDGAATGTWDPKRGRWVPQPASLAAD